jgi:DNA-binding response OmpR family regulator
VIMITADTQPATKALAIAAGIEYFIQKPFSLKLIRELVFEIISVQDNI